LWGLTPVILASPEVESRRFVVPSYAGQKIHEIPSQLIKSWYTPVMPDMQEAQREGSWSCHSSYTGNRKGRIMGQVSPGTNVNPYLKNT
jgi:hypothetical protein